MVKNKHKKVNFKDNDAIFSVISKDKKEVFKARGISKITSKPMYFMDNTSAIEYNFETKDIKCVGNAKKLS